MKLVCCTNFDFPPYNKIKNCVLSNLGIGVFEKRAASPAERVNVRQGLPFAERQPSSPEPESETEGAKRGGGVVPSHKSLNRCFSRIRKFRKKLYRTQLAVRRVGLSGGLENA